MKTTFCLVLCFLGLSWYPVYAMPGRDTENSVPPRQEISLNFATGGDTNMVEFFENHIGPAFRAKYPHIRINVVHTGTGDDGSRAIYTKWKAQLDAGRGDWDMDAACVNQSVMEDLIKNNIIVPYVPQLSNARYVNTPASEYSLGADVKGYVVPLFQSQVVLAYNPARVSTPPKNFNELEAWIKAHPNKFGYNGVVGGMSGVGFTAGWLYAKSENYRTIAIGPYNTGITGTWPGIIKQLKDLPVVITQGNAGTLDMLNRGEIDMGPVWVDMLLLWKSDGRMNPNIKMTLPEPGLPGQPMYLVVASKGKNAEAARLFCDFMADPAVQAEFVVGKYTWYPGIDPSAVFAKCSEESKKLLFGEISPEEIAQKGLALPLAPYMTEMQRVYAEVR
ncbi:extracellular solute-binding protein [Treponema sp. TIM-1]|uniref:extracellular solute-binding protein n=1 Tax=Treponema sp. TIM-1 TaxID=2898417 RepID=UPI003980D435